jgi:hypothetical protein
MRPLWITVCALAVIGAFFVVLQTAWMLKLEPEWLPYVAHPLGALLAGLALSRVASASPRAALVGGVAAVALLAVISYALPHAFTLTAARSSHAIILVPVVALASGAGCWLGARAPVESSRVWVPTVAAFVAACTIQLGGRLAYTLGLPADPAALAAFSIVAAAGAGALVQAVAGGRCERDAAIGVLALLLWGVLQQAVLHSNSALGFWDALMLVGAPLGAAVGARLVRRH